MSIIDDGDFGFGYSRPERKTFYNDRGTATIGKMAAVYGAWQSWVVDQGAVWVNIHGDVMKIEDMDKDYCLNVLIFLYEKHRDDLGSNPNGKKLVQALRERILSDD